MKIKILNDKLYISIFSENDLVFNILENKYNKKILTMLNNTEFIEDLYQLIKKYEDNNILEINT